LKVLEENIAELAELAQEALEDAVLMGVDERELRDTLSRLVSGLINPYKK
jgi:UDP-N-acetylmuramoylalanine-D-glutamate ligase